jgi:putative SOS response-associated peptidase YedK
VLKATEAIPYCITLKGKPDYYFMAGVMREWENVERQDSADTFAIVTTKANEMMQVIHNKKLLTNPLEDPDPRMPTILPEDLAYEWIFGDLSKERIMEIASYQYPSDQMIAWPVDKYFDRIADPTKEVIYENLPPL